jgi:hypothetical protein
MELILFFGLFFFNFIIQHYYFLKKIALWFSLILFLPGYLNPMTCDVGLAG